MTMFLLAAPLLLLGASAPTQDFEAAQSNNTRILESVLAAIEAKDAARIGMIFGEYRYTKSRGEMTTIDAVQMVDLFAGCTTQGIGSAKRVRDFALLSFSCPGRAAAGVCSTGNLELMVYKEGLPYIVASEERRSVRDCAPPAPPAPSRSGSR